MSYRIFIDSFETSFADLKRKQQGDKELVLRIARREKRYSTFEMTQRLMLTLQELEREGHFRIDTSVGYPWVALVFPEAGEEGK